MPKHIKKTLFPSLMIFILPTFVFFGLDSFKNQATSIIGIITAVVSINPLEVNVSAPRETELGGAFKVKAIIINKGEEKIKDAEAEIFLPEGLSLKKTSVQKLGVIPGKKEKKASWQIRGEDIGNFFITVKASGRLEVKELNSEDSVLVKVIKRTSPGRRNFFGFFQRFFDFF